VCSGACEPAASRGSSLGCTDRDPKSGTRAAADRAASVLLNVLDALVVAVAAGAAGAGDVTVAGTTDDVVRPTLEVEKPRGTDCCAAGGAACCSVFNSGGAKLVAEGLGAMGWAELGVEGIPPSLSCCADGAGAGSVRTYRPKATREE
jgi:hypothetical protein